MSLESTIAGSNTNWRVSRNVRVVLGLNKKENLVRKGRQQKERENETSFQSKHQIVKYIVNNTVYGS